MTLIHLHYPTCATWRSNHHGDCDCPAGPKPWCVRNTSCGDSRYAWSVFRRTRANTYDLFMRCTSHAAAMQLVASMMWLSNELKRNPSVEPGRD